MFKKSKLVLTKILIIIIKKKNKSKIFVVYKETTETYAMKLQVNLKNKKVGNY